MAKIMWWQTPQIHREEEEDKERKTSWLDLFSDLVFVVIIAELAHNFGEDVSWGGLGSFVLLFIPAWTIWIGQTFYNDRFEQEDISHRLFIFLQVLGVVALTLNMHYALGKTATGFAICYIALRVLLTTMWLRGGRHNPAFRPVSNRYAIGFSISIMLWIISIFVPTPLKFVLWGIGLLVDLLTPTTTLHLQRNLPRLSQSRMPERFGLFFIIVLGEAIVSVVRGAAERKELTLTAALASGLGLAIALGFWWVYFDQIQTRRPKRPGWWSLSWGYLHLPLLMSLTAGGVGVLKMISYEGQPLPEEVRWLMCGSIAGCFLFLGLIEATLSKAPWPQQGFRILRFGGALLALLVGLLGAELTSLTILAALMLLVSSQMLYGAYLWFSSGGYQSSSPL